MRNMTSGLTFDRDDLISRIESAITKEEDRATEAHRKSLEAYNSRVAESREWATRKRDDLTAALRIKDDAKFVKALVAAEKNWPHHVGEPPTMERQLNRLDELKQYLATLKLAKNNRVRIPADLHWISSHLQD